MIPSVRFDEIYTTNTYLYFASNMWVPSFARYRLRNDSWKPKRFSPFCEINATKFGSKKYILHTIMYHYMTSFDYIFKIIVGSCMIWFHFDCIMQLRKSYHIATNVCSKKVLLLLVISLTDKFMRGLNYESKFCWKDNMLEVWSLTASVFFSHIDGDNWY